MRAHGVLPKIEVRLRTEQPTYLLDKDRSNLAEVTGAVASAAEAREILVGGGCFAFDVVFLTAPLHAVGQRDRAAAHDLKGDAPRGVPNRASRSEAPAQKQPGLAVGGPRDGGLHGQVSPAFSRACGVREKRGIDRDHGNDGYCGQKERQHRHAVVCAIVSFTPREVDARQRACQHERSVLARARQR